MSEGKGYLIPDDPIPEDFRCLCIVIPDDDMYQYAFFGAYEFFATWQAWEKDKDKRGRLAAQAWKDAVRMTREIMACNYDYTEVFGQIADAIRTIRITQNVTCGGGGDIYFDDDGNPIVNPPIYPPIRPPGDGEWPVDPITDDPPDGFDNWDAFDLEACAVANAVYDLMVYGIIALEGVTDALAGIALLILTIAALIPSAVAAIIGTFTLYEWAWALVEIGAFEQTGDWILDIRGWLESNQEEIVCLIYEYRHDVPGMQSEFISRLMLHMHGLYSLQEEEATALRNFGKRFFPFSLFFSWLYEAGVYIEANSVIDCSSCDGGTQAFAWSSKPNPEENEPDSMDVISSSANAVEAEGNTIVEGTTESSAIVSYTDGFDPATDIYCIRFDLVEVSTTIAAAYYFYSFGVSWNDRFSLGDPMVPGEYQVVSNAYNGGDEGNADFSQTVYGGNPLPPVPAWPIGRDDACFAGFRASASPEVGFMRFDIINIRFLDIDGNIIAIE